MTRLLTLAGIALIGATLAGCSDHHGRSDSDSDSDSDANANAQVNFADFVKKEINNTRDDREAVSVNDVDFSFNNQNDPHAFDDVLQ